MKVELLAPAGSYEALEAAFEAGADAVYLGGQKFGARAYADNLDQEQLIRAIDLAHLKGKQLYLTINTLLKNRELETELYEYLAPLYEAGLDAVIVQDPGVMDFVKTYFPGLHIHALDRIQLIPHQFFQCPVKFRKSLVPQLCGKSHSRRLTDAHFFPQFRCRQEYRFVIIFQHIRCQTFLPFTESLIIFLNPQQ